MGVLFKHLYCHQQLNSLKKQYKPLSQIVHIMTVLLIRHVIKQVFMMRRFHY